MKDIEMLELAAKAASIMLEWDEPPNEWQPMYYEGKTYHSFNPLTDDDDALRLAVKLGADIQPKGNGVEVWVFESRVSSGVVEYGDDPYAATRRAIVRAAAKIGEGME